MVTVIDVVTHTQVANEYLELNEKYKYLIWTPVKDGYCIEGTISLSAQHRNVSLQIEYHVRIDIPKDYPRTIPVCYEIGNKIEPSYHQYQNGRLCLGVDTNQYMKFRSNQRLLGFVNDLLIPYLFGYEYFVTFGITAPWSEERHNAPGLVDYYSGYFENVSSISQLLHLLMYTIVLRNVYLPNNPCPCGSGKHVRLCHKDKVLQLRKLCIGEILLRDVCYIINNILLEPTMLSESEVSNVISLKTFIDKHCLT